LALLQSSPLALSVAIPALWLRRSAAFARLLELKCNPMLCDECSNADHRIKPPLPARKMQFLNALLGYKTCYFATDEPLIPLHLFIQCDFVRRQQVQIRQLFAHSFVSSASHTGATQSFKSLHPVSKAAGASGFVRNACAASAPQWRRQRHVILAAAAVVNGEPTKKNNEDKKASFSLKMWTWTWEAGNWLLRKTGRQRERWQLHPLVS
jgi:hypothetical protein